MSLDEAWIACARSVPIEDELARRGIKLNGKVERDGPCPKCGGDDRFSINTAKQVFNCRGCGTGGDVIDLVRHLDGVSFIEACKTLAGEPPKANGKDHAAAAREVCVATFKYTDESGAVLFEIGRLQYRNPDGSFILKDGKPKKTFRQRRPNPDRPDQWINNVDGVRTVPYRLPELIEAIANGCYVLIVEGEGKVDLLRTWNVPATCNAMGAGKWKPAHAEFLRDANVVILPDNNEPGRDHADIVGASLQTIAKSIRVLELPNLPPKGDVVDWAKRGGTVEQLHDLIEHQARPWMSRAKAEQQQDASGEDNNPPEQLIVSSAEFTESFECPDPLIEGIVMRKFIYALTGHVSKGKTAGALLFAAHIGLGKMLGNLEVEQGRVLYLAGENYVDIQMRWIAMAQQMDFDIKTIPVHFRRGRIKLSAKMDSLRAEVKQLGGVDFIVVDGSTAFFEGDDENSNAQASAHACMLRELTTFEGQPGVLVLCHPPKNAGDDNLQPRGGGAMIAEWDGNLTATKDGSVTTIQIKIRGPDFAPVSLLLRNVTHERLVSKKGKLMPTVIAEPLSAEREEEMQKAARNEEDELMKAINDHPKCSQAELARYLGWLNRKGTLLRAKVHRIVKDLKRQKLLEEGRSGIELTSKGKAAIKEKTK